MSIHRNLGRIFFQAFKYDVPIVPIGIMFYVISSTTLAQDTKYTQSLKYTEQGYLLVENFEEAELDQLPYQWFEQKGQNRPYDYPLSIKEDYEYTIRVEENGTPNHFLRFEGNKAKHLNFPLHEVENLWLQKTPILSWKWRIWDIPENADENIAKKNDVAASIYVVFKIKKLALVRDVPQSIRYTWSSSLREGTEFSTFFGHQKVVVVGQGQPTIAQDDQLEWMTFRRNLLDDYRRLFGEEPPDKPLAILILSDGDSTGDFVKADYDDILFEPDN